ncbi:T9SS type A sorting domain-containing protein [bacterium]|nr:T9SS type A sorting domain-containing protein [bacterium]
MKYAVTALLLACATTFAHAQIQITRADVEARMGATQMTSYDSTFSGGTTFDLSGSVYDLSMITGNATTVQTMFMDPAQTPYPHEFPDATDAQAVQTGEGAGYMYLRLSDEGLYALGIGAEVQGMDFLLKYNPEKPQMLFPLQNGTNWTYQSGVMSPFDGMEQVEQSDIEVVGEGTLRTPEGDTPCLVVKEWSRSTTKIEFGGQVLTESYTTDISYQFLTKTGVSGSISIDTLDADSNTPGLVYASWSKSEISTGTENVPLARDLTVRSVYPNPVASGQITVEWFSASAGNVRLSVVDVLGRERIAAWSENVNAGMRSTRLQLGTLPQGRYFLRIQQGTDVAMRPLSVVH